MGVPTRSAPRRTQELTLRVEFEADARRDIRQGARWHEDQRPSFGQRFIHDLDDAVDTARQWPNAGQPVGETPTGTTVRRIPLRRFPYHVGYMVLDDVLKVIAVAHDSRHPDHWQQRIHDPDPER